MFHRFPFVYSPEYYGCGMAGGELDLVPGKFFNPRHVDINERIKKWQLLHLKHKDKLFESNRLREIYPINYINENHLNHEVFSKSTLRDWICATDHRGTLENVTDELYAWIIPDEDLYQVTVDLAPTGILLCVNKDNPQRYDYGVRPEDQIVL
jgi:hypothetical protein